MANIVYIMGLIAMCSISLAHIVPSISRQPESNVIDIALENRIFMMQDSLELAKLYLDDAAMYSIYQAMHDNGVNGGFESMGGSSLLQYEGHKYTVWYNNMDIAPDESDITDALEAATKANLKKYTEDGSIRAFFFVPMPRYNSITVTNLEGQGVRLEASSASGLSLRETAESGDVLTAGRNSTIDLRLPSPYFSLYGIAKGYHDELEGKLPDCEKASIEIMNEDKGCCSADLHVLDSTDGSCLVRVEVKSKEGLVVWDPDDEKSVLAPVSLVFLERLGPVMERCMECTASDGTWCIQSEKCSTGGVTNDCPSDSVIAGASCMALDQLTCQDCISNVLPDGGWAWCPDQGVCAQSCTGETVTDIDDC